MPQKTNPKVVRKEYMFSESSNLGLWSQTGIYHSVTMNNPFRSIVTNRYNVSDGHKR